MVMFGITSPGDQWRDRLNARWWPAQKAAITKKLMKKETKLGVRLMRVISWSRSVAVRGRWGGWTSMISRVMAMANTASEKKISRSSGCEGEPSS